MNFPYQLTLVLFGLYNRRTPFWLTTEDRPRTITDTKNRQPHSLDLKTCVHDKNCRQACILYNLNFFHLSIYFYILIHIYTYIMPKPYVRVFTFVYV